MNIEILCFKNAKSLKNILFSFDKSLKNLYTLFPFTVFNIMGFHHGIWLISTGSGLYFFTCFQHYPCTWSLLSQLKRLARHVRKKNESPSIMKVNLHHSYSNCLIWQLGMCLDNILIHFDEVKKVILIINCRYTRYRSMPG